MDSVDLAMGVVAVPEGPLLAQSVTRSTDDMKARKRILVVKTYAIDPLTGDGTRLEAAWDRILAANEDHILTYSQDPFPQVKLWQLK